SGSTGADKEVHKAGLQVGEQGVADFLRRHPEFFEDKPTLLADLRIPHHAGNAVSLIERQIQALRESNESRQAQLDALIQIARENDTLNYRLHQLTLQLMECDELDSMLTIISNRLRKDFNADLVEIRLLASPVNETQSHLSEFVADVDAFCGQFQRLLGVGKPFCGRLKTEQLQLLFADRAEAIGSTALLPLGKDGMMGLLAIGSFERGRFSASADTDFLVRMGEIITVALKKHLDSPEVVGS
ncbi:DUF484 family protein, partial [Kaarinaea lacus]